MNDQAKRWTAEPSGISDSTDVLMSGETVAECHATNMADHAVTATRLAACADLLRGVGDLEGVAVIPGWVKCSERMPESLTYVLVHDTSGGRPFCARWFSNIHKWMKDTEDLRVDGDGTIDGDDCPPELIACWMPMPVPPKGDA